MRGRRLPIDDMRGNARGRVELIGGPMPYIWIGRQVSEDETETYVASVSRPSDLRKWAKACLDAAEQIERTRRAPGTKEEDGT